MSLLCTGSKLPPRLTRCSHRLSRKHHTRVPRHRVTNGHRNVASTHFERHIDDPSRNHPSYTIPVLRITVDPRGKRPFPVHLARWTHAPSERPSFRVHTEQPHKPLTNWPQPDVASATRADRPRATLRAALDLACTRARFQWGTLDV